jgi:hypothetical protein
MQPNIPSSILSFAVCGLKWILLFPCQINKIGLNSAKLNETSPEFCSKVTGTFWIENVKLQERNTGDVA